MWVAQLLNHNVATIKLQMTQFNDNIKKTRMRYSGDHNVLPRFVASKGDHSTLEEHIIGIFDSPCHSIGTAYLRLIY